MLIIEIHADTIEENNPSASKKRMDETPKQGHDKSKNTGGRFWKNIKHRVPGYLIQYHKNEK